MGMIISQSSLSSKDLFVRVDSSRIWAICQYKDLAGSAHSFS